MTSRTPSSRAARARAVLVGMLAITLITLYAIHHRAERGQILDELRPALPSTSRAFMTQSDRW